MAKFPGAIFVFATLRESLEAEEKKLISKVAQAGRRLKSGGIWRSPVMVLTAHELMASTEPPYCWSNKGGRFETMTKRARTGLYNLQDLCRATQFLHLEMSDVESNESP